MVIHTQSQIFIVFPQVRKFESRRCFFFFLFKASLSRPKSLLVSSPSTKLLTLEEAQARTQAQVNSPIVTENKYIEVGEGPAALQGKFHTIIEFPLER